MVMDSYTAVAIVEDFGEGANASPEQQIEAWQYLVDTGLVWALQGVFGRTAVDMIAQGVLHPPQPIKHDVHGLPLDN